MKCSRQFTVQQIFTIHIFNKSICHSYTIMPQRGQNCFSQTGLPQRYLPQYNKSDFNAKSAILDWSKSTTWQHTLKNNKTSRGEWSEYCLFFPDSFKGISLSMTKYKSGCKRWNIRFVQKYNLRTHMQKPKSL